MVLQIDTLVKNNVVVFFKLSIHKSNVLIYKYKYY